MKLTIIEAQMNFNKTDGYVGKVQFSAEGHSNRYEMALQSKKGKDWGYGLFFLHESGNEEQLDQMEDLLEEDDELFDFLIEAAMERLVQQAE